MPAKTAPAKTKPVTLKWFVSTCDKCDPPWESNPTPDRDHADEHGRHHDATVHAPVEEA